MSDSIDSIERAERVVLVPSEFSGKRFDVALSTLFPEFSRSRLQQWIKEGNATLNGKTARPRDPVSEEDEIRFSPVAEEEVVWEAENIPLQIAHEDDAILVVNKSAGMVVHPAAGNWSGTLVNALLHHEPKLAELPRAGIVHRLDKETSGLLVVAKTLEAHTSLVRQLQARTMKREYRAVVYGVMTAGGNVDAPIGRHPRERKKMAIVETGKPAVTHYRIVQKFRAHTDIRLSLETGRTHQIRVHMEKIRFPLVGDPVYGTRLRIPKNSSEDFIAVLRNFKRQALHAAKLGLEHPETGALVEWEAPLPDDMQQLLRALAQDQQEHTTIS